MDKLILIILGVIVLLVLIGVAMYMYSRPLNIIFPKGTMVNQGFAPGRVGAIPGASDYYHASDPSTSSLHLIFPDDRNHINITDRHDGW